jgi:hypothetical protein
VRSNGPGRLIASVRFHKVSEVSCNVAKCPEPGVVVDEDVESIESGQEQSDELVDGLGSDSQR